MGQSFTTSKIKAKSYIDKIYEVRLKNWKTALDAYYKRTLGAYGLASQIDRNEVGDFMDALTEAFDLFVARLNNNHVGDEEVAKSPETNKLILAAGGGQDQGSQPESSNGTAACGRYQIEDHLSQQEQKSKNIEATIHGRRALDHLSTDSDVAGDVFWWEG